MRRTGSSIIVAAVVVGVSLMMQRQSQGQTKAPAYKAPRAADGKPDLSGLWQAVNSAAWNIQDHSAQVGQPAFVAVHRREGQDGQVVNWALELGPVNALYRRGWTKHSVPNGIEVVVEGFAAKNGQSRANGRTITFPDGRKLFAGSSGTGAPSDGRHPTERR